MGRMNKCCADSPMMEWAKDLGRKLDVELRDNIKSARLCLKLDKILLIVFIIAGITNSYAGFFGDPDFRVPGYLAFGIAIILAFAFFWGKRSRKKEMGEIREILGFKKAIETISQLEEAIRESRETRSGKTSKV